MEIQCQWVQKLTFVAKATDSSHEVKMDTIPPLGNDNGPSPKQLLLMSVVGCTAMDVVALLRKFKQETAKLEVIGHAVPTKTQPAVFPRIDLDYKVSGQVDAEKLKEAVRLSMSLYCGVSAMIKCPIFYKIHLNEALIHEDQADFSKVDKSSGS